MPSQNLSPQSGSQAEIIEIADTEHHT